MGSKIDIFTFWDGHSTRNREIYLFRLFPGPKIPKFNCFYLIMVRDSSLGQIPLVRFWKSQDSEKVALRRSRNGHSELKAYINTHTHTQISEKVKILKKSRSGGAGMATAS